MLATSRPHHTCAFIAASVIGLWSSDLHASEPDVPTIVGGSPVTTCGWPTTLFTGGCTGTLIHPKAISTAQHCGRPSSVKFADTANGQGQTVAVLGCVGDGSADAQICELDQEVTDLPVTPVLYGCEAEQYLVPGQPVVIAGFGQTSYGQGGGTKLWADQAISAVEPGRVIIGNPGEPQSPCSGDSGGPVFVQVADGSWRTIGALTGGTTGTPCNSAADYKRVDQVVPFFEQQRGIDITPCFDAATGAWDAGPDCGGFFAGNHEGSGSWSDWCAGTPASGYSDACGEPFGDDGDGTTGGSGGSDTSGDGGGGSGSGTGGSDGGNSDDAGSDGGGTGGSGSDDSSGDDYAGEDSPSGCGCTSHPSSPMAPLLGGFVLVAVRPRRRDRRPGPARTPHAT